MLLKWDVNPDVRNIYVDIKVEKTPQKWQMMKKKHTYSWSWPFENMISLSALMVFHVHSIKLWAPIFGMEVRWYINIKIMKQYYIKHKKIILQFFSLSFLIIDVCVCIMYIGAMSLALFPPNQSSLKEES